MDPETIEGILTTKALEQQTLNIALEKNLAAEEAGVKPVATEKLFETLTGIPTEARPQMAPEFDPKAKVDEKERQRLAEEAAIKALTSEEAKKKAEAAKKTEAAKQSKIVIKLPVVTKQPKKTKKVKEFREELKLRRSTRQSLSRSLSVESEEDILNNTAKKKDKTGNYIVMDQETRRCYANMMLLNKERTLSVTKELLDIVK